MIRVAVVEDEEVFAEQLLKHIDEYRRSTQHELSAVRFSDGEDITEGYSADYDIILLDVKMQFMDGIKAAKKIRQYDDAVIIIFITSLAQYAIKGYEVDALTYILKPVSYFALSQQLDRAIARLKGRDTKYISIPIAGGVQKLNIADVFFVESQGHSLLFDTKTGVHKSTGRLEELEELLSPHGFFRSNKGYLVNMKYVDGVKDGDCIVRGRALQISRRRKSEFLKEFSGYISEAIK